jgi:predicted transposase
MMDRTIRIRLLPDSAQAEALKETAQQFTAAFNAACAAGWEQRTGNAYTIQRLVYRRSKSVLPSLVSDHHQTTFLDTPRFSDGEERKVRSQSGGTCLTSSSLSSILEA